MAAPTLHQAPLPVSDQRVLLSVIGRTVVPQSASPGTKVAPAPGMPAQPHRTGPGLILPTPARPGSPADAENRLHVVFGIGGRPVCPAGRLARLVRRKPLGQLDQTTQLIASAGQT